MKLRIFLLFVFFIVWVSVSKAQIKVHNNNHVSIGNLTTSWGVQVYPSGYTLFEPSGFAPYVWLNLTHAFNPYAKCYIVQYGNSHNFFVYGNGQVYSQGSFINSDFNVGKGIYNLDSALSKVLSLRGIYYEIKEGKEKYNDTISIFNKNGNTNNEISNPIHLDSANQYVDQQVLDSLISERGRRYIGLIAREVEKVVPELVRTMPDGTKAVAYYSLTGLLVEAIKEQQEQIDSLKKLLKGYFEALEKTSLSDLKFMGNKPNITTAENLGILFQNIPNPFSDNTTIRFTINNPSNKVSIFIFDLQGTLIKEFNNLNQQKGEIIIRGYELKPGMYFYTLMIDGIEIDTKRMILTK
ncbi:MAG: T9SS type A sorting domain-containing protein [Bacteroidales bacterium]|jgi:hypothetical protein|nr:T9SS type A sorting domain-containing protein [Bacteroidales bacterium]